MRQSDESEQPTVRAFPLTRTVLLLLALALAFIGIGILAAEASALQVPAGGFNYVSGTYVFDQGNTVTGNLIVGGTASVTLDGASVTFTSAYQIRVNNGGTLIIKNATLQRTGGTYWYLYLYQGSHARIYDSNIVNVYQIYLQSQDVEIHNNVISAQYYLVYVYAWGLSWPGTEDIIITDNLFSKSYYGIQIYGYNVNALNVQIIIRDNLFIDNRYRILYNYLYSSPNGPELFFEGNSAVDNGQNNQYLMYVTYPNPAKTHINANTIVNNEGNGIYSYDWVNPPSQLDLNDNVITGNGVDLYLYNIVVSSKSNIIGKITAAGNGYFENSFLASVEARWESDSSPVSGATIIFTDTMGGQKLDVPTTDGDGWIHDVLLKQRYADASGDKTFTPYEVTVIKGVRQGVATLELTGDDEVTVYLDNLPPNLLITSPVDGMVTNGNEVLVRGQTDLGVALNIGGFSTQVDRFGMFELTLPLPLEGANTILITAADLYSNVAPAELTVIKDITPPSLTIDGPTDGSLTGAPTILLAGAGEVGSTLKVNGQLVPLQSDGSFSIEEPIGEGTNSFSLVLRDAAGNTAQRTIELQGDFSAPEIVVFTPSPGSVSGSSSLEVQGRVDRNSVVTLNGQPVEVIGTSFVGTVQGLTEGENQVQIHAVDLAGNEADLTLSVLVDLTAPALTIDSPAPDTLTGDRRISVAGTTDARSLVINGLEVTSYNPGVGSYRTQVGLKEGLNVITVTAYDENGNPFSRTTSVTLDTLAPRLEVTSPAPGYVTSASSVELMGSSEPGATLQVNGKVIFADGEFTTSVALLEGENLLTLSARDPAGNVRSLTTSVVRDSVMQLSLDHTEPTTKKEHVTIKGRAEPGATVTVADQRADVDALGRFSAEVPLALGDNRIEVSATDTVGNEASTSAEVERREATTSFVDGAQESANRVVTSLQDLYGVLLLLVVAAGMAVAYGHASRRVRAAEVKLKRARNRPPVVLSSVPTMGPTYGASGPAVPLTLPGAPGVGALAPLGGGLAAQGGVPMLMALPPTMSDPTYAAAMAGQQVVAAPTSAAEPPLDPTLQSDLDALGAKADAYEAAGWDVKKVRNYLRMATFFARKGQQEKVDTYLGKVGESFEEMDAQAGGQ